jgi:hypothetical protein
VLGITSNSLRRAPKWLKNAGSNQIDPVGALEGGNVKKTRQAGFLGAVVLMCAGLLVAGCKSAPELSASQAQALIQAHYDALPAVGTDIVVDDQGMRLGVTNKYWEGIKKYQNSYWVDLKLTDAGKKVLSLQKGGNLIEWHPENATDPHYFIVVTTVAANHLKAHDVQDPQTDVGGTKSVVFTEAQSLDGVPAPLQQIAKFLGNKLTTKRTATFIVDGAGWKLQSIN